MIAINGVTRQPPHTPVFSNQTYRVDLASNNSQIVSRSAISGPAREFMTGVGTRFAIRMIHVWDT